MGSCVAGMMCSMMRFCIYGLAGCYICSVVVLWLVMMLNMV